LDLGSLEPVITFYGLVVGSYGFGTWLGKTIGLAFGIGMSTWGDNLGVVGGLLGTGVFIGYLVGKVVS
jgi:hypothetical protein